MARKAGFDRAEIVGRARDLFWRKGWAGTSMKDLEAALNLRPGSVYAAFGSKEGLYAEALDRYAADGQAAFADAVARHGPLGGLRAHLRAVVAPGRPAAACLLAKTLLETRDGPLARAADASLAAMEGAFADAFAAARAAGAVHADRDPVALARRYQSDLIGLRAMAERPGVDADALAREIGAGLDRFGEPPAHP